ncbi:flagellar biosynthesis protein FlhB [Simiduia agarivorans]|uniref:Flagellar biosynthetic protein FlhB n=1 Tax=Simiduia agarivorans (strain DSM 21679 / JCM 13881 / BCRC 17597 / SA1) TaxID=1117647 RepID=K4KFJ8_SIMAS|nr:flagellar biosynthesis protein FlhB [Simiduia agarivorans]AFU97701.1 flagellar biosynthesis protein FlhB [Simiduia agarivorans SA1 = DSM 21679]
MAEENDSSQEKTEEATPRRLEKAREEGQIPRSKELTTTVMLLAGSVALLASGPFMGSQLGGVFESSMRLDRASAFDPSQMLAILTSSLADSLLALLPLFFTLAVAAFVGPILLGGWLVSSKAMEPKLSRMSLLAGLKRMFSVKSLVELLKAVAKVGVILLLAVGLLRMLRPELLGLANESVETAISHAVWLAIISALILSASTALIAAVDVPFQLWEHARKLRMSMQDIKDEYKESEGKPEVKSKIKQLQREMANRRMMAAVPDADVVITNPTHYSVALKYDPSQMATPVLVAKGADEIALKIREIANAHGVELVASPALARSVFHTTDVDETIPAGLYMAVAQVLAYVFQLRNYRTGRGKKPYLPTDIQIPADLRYD